jgi:uncharacterized protein
MVPTENTKENEQVMADRIAMGLGAAVLSLGMVGTGLIVSKTWEGNRQLNQTLSVTGSAKKSITADLGIFSGTLVVSGTSQLEANTELKKQSTDLLAELKARGFDDKKVERNPVNISPVYELNDQGNPTNVVTGWSGSQSYSVRSTDVQSIKKLSLSLNDVIDKGISFQVNQPQYLYTKLADVRIAMQEAAAKDAKVRAEKIVAATGQGLGNLRDASMGVIQVTARDDTQVDDTGALDTSSIEKDITAVVRLSFAIK